MGLEKAIIEVEGGERIPVLFNPTQYSLNKSNQYKEVRIPGLNSPVLQYDCGSTRTLSMELFFDTFEKRTDVRKYTNKIFGLLEIKKETHVPPICVFRWGRLDLKCVLDHVDGTFLLFLTDGTPVRAKLNVTFKEYIGIKSQVRKTPTESADHTKTRTVKQGDTLCSIAAAEYNDPSKWRPIAKANRINNPRFIEPGKVLIIPPLE